MGLISQQWTTNNGYEGPENNVFYENIGAGNSAVTNVSSLTWNHSSFGGPNCLVVGIATIYFTGGTKTMAMSYGGTGMNFMTQSAYLTGTNLETIAMWALAAPASGTQTVTLTLTGAATVHDVSGNTLSLQNVGSTNVLTNSANGTGTAASVSITSLSAGATCVGAIAANGEGQTGQFIWSDGLFATILGTVPITINNAPTGTYSSTLTASSQWGAVMLAASPPVIRQSLLGPKGHDPSVQIARSSLY